MPTATMQEDRDFTPPSAPPDDGAPAPQSPGQFLAGMMSPVMALGPAGHLGTKPEIERELDLIAAAIRTFYAKPADMVMRECSAYTARLTEMAVLLQRMETTDRIFLRIRTQQVQRFLDEADRQWKTASRLVEIQRLDVAMIRGNA